MNDFEMKLTQLSPLASIEAVRPVFLIVMGIFLMVLAWRLAKISERWPARIIIAGALLLGVGYSVIMPLYEAGIIKRYSSRHFHGNATTAMAWQMMKLIAMNGGWLLFGLGVALHAKVFAAPAPRRTLSPSPKITPHEFIAKTLPRKGPAV
jgi:hypothetical protein